MQDLANGNLYKSLILGDTKNKIVVFYRNVVKNQELIVMKKKVHPELHEVSAHCACGATFNTRSTSSDIHVTLCSQCHPFYTGAQKFVDTAGRIEKFEKRYKKGKKK